MKKEKERINTENTEGIEENRKKGEGKRKKSI